MNKYIYAIMSSLLVTFFSFSAFAWSPPPAPSDGTYVVDQTGKLSASDKARLNQQIEAVNRSTGNEFGILLLADMQGTNIEDVAYSTFRAWGVGKKGLDNGCLIVVALKERKSRIETGKGVGGDVPDIVANDILRLNLNPYLKKGNFYGAFNSTLTALAARIESRKTAAAAAPSFESSAPSTLPANPSSNTKSDTGAGFFAVLFAIVIAFVGGLLALLGMTKKKTPEPIPPAPEWVKDIYKREYPLSAAPMPKMPEMPKMPAMPTMPKMPAMPAVPKMPSKPIVTKKPQAIKPVGNTYYSYERTEVYNPKPAKSGYQPKVNKNSDEERRATKRREEEEESRRRREEDDRRRRDDEDAASRRRQQEDDDRRRSDDYSSPSSSSFDWGGGSSGGSDDGGGGSGFGGGDSGGGGSSSDW